uniref:RING-type E3 ubiquitin transferase n=1 Tax=Kalanchoe fedtschenkoi TaxID=63787 RepID=A0A7N0U1W7_KALFE
MDLDNIKCVSITDGLDEDEIHTSTRHHHYPFQPKPHNNNNTLNALPSCHQRPRTCHNGHTLCSTCKTRAQNRCLTCRHELGDIRCLALEKVAELLELPCKYYSLGCPEIFPYYSKLKHESQCNFRPYSCLYAGSECAVAGDISFVVAHLRDDHKVDMHIGYTFNHRYMKIKSP